MYTRYLPVPANAQLKPAAVSPDFRHWHTLPRNSPFSAAMRPVSAAKTAHFGKQNGTFRNSLTACRLAKAALTGYFNIKMAMAVRVDRRARGARAVCGCSKKIGPETAFAAISGSTMPCLQDAQALPDVEWSVAVSPPSASSSPCGPCRCRAPRCMSRPAGR